MITRNSLRLAHAARVKVSRAVQGQCRRHISYNAGTTAANVGSTWSTALASITSELDKLSPHIAISADSITILRSPEVFYETLKQKIAKAQTRIFLATLYIGKSEYELIQTVREALRANSTLQVSFLTDALRGTREAPDPSCASLLASLIEEFGDRVEVRLFHTPNLTGLRKKLLPKRINEGWGLQHMKLYGIDDDIIMSGANLSNDYFTNRQDRYHVFASRDVTDYFHRVYRNICKLSYRVLPGSQEQGGFVQQWPNDNIQPAPLDDPQKFIASATTALQPLTNHQEASQAQTTAADTYIYPLLQMTPLLKPDTSTELPAMTGILRQVATPALKGSRWTFTAGYFNMTPEVRALLLQSQPASATVIAASPWANGFYGSKGISGLLPAAYTLLSRRFLDAVASAGLNQQIILKEWRKGTVNTPGGWTYHAKGLWVTLPGNVAPSISLIGSSNYTQRSYSLDLEASALIVTQNADLKRRLGEEEAWLQEHATVMTRDDYAKTERRVGLHVRLAMALVSLLGGAL